MKFRKVLLAALAMMIIFTFSAPTFAKTQFPEFKRIAGIDRVETAVKISQEGWPNGANVVLLASKDNFPDALVATPLAYQLDGPILLTSGKELSDKTKKEIQRLKPKKAIILGGPSAISDKVFNQVKQLVANVERIGGKNRYETSYLINERLKVDYNKGAFLVNGKNFPDALSVAAIAAQKGFPIYLTDGEYADIWTLQHYNIIYAVGGPKLVPQSILNQVYQFFRFYGENRYETLYQVIKRLNVDVSNAYFVTGENFADALTGSVLAAKNNAALLLVPAPKFKGSYSIDNELKAIKPLLSSIKSVTLIGGARSVHPILPYGVLMNDSEDQVDHINEAFTTLFNYQRAHETGDVDLLLLTTYPASIMESYIIERINLAKRFNVKYEDIIEVYFGKHQFLNLEIVNMTPNEIKVYTEGIRYAPIASEEYERGYRVDYNYKRYYYLKFYAPKNSWLIYNSEYILEDE